MADQTNGKTTLYAGNSYVLKALGDNHTDDFSLRHGGLYVEFSSTQWADMVWLLQPEGHGAYMSVRHSTGKSGDVPRPLDAMLQTIRDGEGDSLTESTREVAFGNYEVDGVGSPVKQAGFADMFEDNPWYARIDDQFDTYVRMHLYEERGHDYNELRDPPNKALIEECPELDEGTIPEPLARRLWFKAAEAQQGMNNIDGEGYEVAEELGWL